MVKINANENLSSVVIQQENQGLLSNSERERCCKINGIFPFLLTIISIKAFIILGIITAIELAKEDPSLEEKITLITVTALTGAIATLGSCTLFSKCCCYESSCFRWLRSWINCI
jgi:hypothetical protein